MKKILALLVTIIILASSGFFILKHSYKKFTATPNLKQNRGPGNPGWWEQWFEMKKDENGNIPFDRILRLRQQVATQRTMKSGESNLTNIQELGPNNVGGRTRAFLVDKTNPNRLFAGGVSGGLWVSNNGGNTWNPVNDDASNLSITFITQNPFTPNVLYYSTGECAGNSAGISGDGVYKSTDGGNSFFKLPSTNSIAFNYTWRIACSLTDTNTLYVATRDSGLYRSTDAGLSFHQVINSGEITDLEVFRDGSVIAARSGHGLFRSPDGSPGSFVAINNGLPASGFYRVEMAYCDSVPNIMYVAHEATSGNDILGLYKSTDGGNSWFEVTNPTSAGVGFPFPWYCLAIGVRPNNPNYVLVGSVNCGYSMDGGNSWNEHHNSHADYHIFVFNPANPNECYVGNDGGVYKYYPQTNIAYVDLNKGYRVTQFYAGTYFPVGNKCWGGTQDNGTQSGSSLTQNFEHIFGGDGAFTAIHPQSPNIGYVSWQNGHILKCYDAHNPMPYFEYIMGDMDANNDFDIDDDTWFINPFEINKQDGDQLFFVTRDRMWRSIDGGNIWEKCTKPITDLYAIGISNEPYPIVYVGGRGKLRRLDNAYVSMPGDEVNLNSSIPTALNTSFMSNIIVSANDPSTLYVSFSSYVNQPRVWKVTNATTTPVWTSIHGDLPQGLPVNWIEVSPYDENIMAAATDFGLYTTTDGGNHWVLEEDIPFVSIHQLRLRHSDNTLFIFTHGRGIWKANLPLTGLNIASQSNALPVRIYPTITHNEPIQIILPHPETYQLAVLDLHGKKLYSQTIYQSIVIHPEIYRPGIYFITLTQYDKLIKSERIVIQ
ncbi:MAG: T9SS type A sorting domain-containing protein [Flavobacteriales bacterium]|nr:T9SS type A sorting domain-containing protein [Flavobacteriales bacterium]